MAVLETQLGAAKNDTRLKADVITSAPGKGIQAIRMMHPRTSF